MLQWPHDVETLAGVASQLRRSRVVGGVGAERQDPAARGVESPDRAGRGGGALEQRLANELGISRSTLLRWRARYREAAVTGLLKDAPRPGRRKRIRAVKVDAIVTATLHTTPRDATRWSVRSMAQAQRVSPATVHRIWQAAHLQPRRTKTSSEPGPAVVRKVRDVVGLYRIRRRRRCPERRRAESDQALDRTQPILALRAGRPPGRPTTSRGTGRRPVCRSQCPGGHVIEACQLRHMHAQSLVSWTRSIGRRHAGETSISSWTTTARTRVRP